MCCVHMQCITQYWLSLLIVFTAAGPLEVHHQRSDVWWGRRQGVVRGIVRPPSFRSQELTELCATLQLRLEVILKHMATHHRRLQNGPNSDRMLPLTYSRQTLHGAVGFWASRELLVCCVDRLCFVPSCVFALKKLLLNKQRLTGKFSFTY